jgi:S-formylglutathione hydrolase FrmB
MALCELKFFSHVLGKQCAMNVILPDAGQGPFATFYLLHGMSDDYSTWARRSRIEWYVRDWPLIVVMPDGFKGFYTRNNEGPDFATYLAEEVVYTVERFFPAKPTRAARCIGGLSMGGYGAFRCALDNPQLFVSATSHSGALLRGSVRWERPEDADLRRVFGRDPSGSRHDLMELVRRGQGTMPKLRFDCGTEDFLLDDNRTFHAFLDYMGVKHEYEEFPGGHDWDYWDLHVRDALRFHAKALRLRRVKSV